MVHFRRQDHRRLRQLVQRVVTLDSRGRGDVALRTFAGLVGFHALIQVACVGLSLAGVALGRATSIVTLVLAAVLAVLFASRFETTHRESDTPGPEIRASPFFRWAFPLGVGAAVLWSVTIWGRLWQLAFRRPTYDWDGLYYHIPAVHEWVLKGGIAWLEGFPDVPFVNYPMAIEAHTFFTYELLRIDSLVDALNLWFWPLAFFALVVTAGLFGARGGWRWLAGALLAGAPVLVAQSVTCYVDPGAAACVMAAFAATLLLVFCEGSGSVWRVLLWGASVGLVLGSKGTGIVAVPVFAVAAVGGGLWREGWRRWPMRLRRIALGLTITTVTGGYWYLRNAYHTGNPVYPIEVRFGARVLIPGYDAAGMMNNELPDWLARFPPLLRPPVSWLQLDAPIQGYAPIGGLGYVWLVAGLPSIVILASRSFRNRFAIARRELQFALILILLLLIVQPAAWWARFTLWLHALGLPSVARVIQDIDSRRVWWRASLSFGALIAVLGLAVWESERTLALEAARGRVAQQDGSGEAYVSTLDAMFPGMEASEGFDRLLAAPRIARSLWSRAGTLLGGSLATPLGRRRLSLLPEDPSEDDLDRIQEEGVEWVLWDVVGAGDVPASVRARAIEEHRYSPASDVDFRAVRLRAPMAAEPLRTMKGR